MTGDDGAGAGGAAAPAVERTDRPITERLFPDWDGYCKDRTRRDVFDVFESGTFNDARLF
jgi:hypothetical protein